MPELPRAQLVAYVVAAVLVVLVGVRVLGGRGDRGGSGGSAAVKLDAAPGGPEATAGRRSRASRLFVHVAGAVRRPGLYRVRVRSRTAAAIARAGGPARDADLAGVNLAAPLRDGQQVIVPRRGAGAVGVASSAAGAGGAPAGAASLGPGAPKLSLATATVPQLDRLDGIGPKLAQRIIAYRDSRGGFKSIGELRQVEGIGPKRFADLSKSLQP